MHWWDYLVILPLLGAAWYFWKQTRKKKAACGGCSSCPVQSCKNDAKRKN